MDSFVDLRALPSPLFIVGASHTGKSELALTALDRNLETAVFGTADARETAFAERIALLKSHRPANWDTVEDNPAILERLAGLRSECQQILIDSLNQWVASRLIASLKKHSSEQIERLVIHEAEAMIRALSGLPDKRIVVVSSEIASGVTPSGEVPRLFRQLASRVNCLFAAAAASVVLVTAGIPLVIKRQMLQRPVAGVLP